MHSHLKHKVEFFPLYKRILTEGDCGIEMFVVGPVMKETKHYLLYDNKRETNTKLVTSYSALSAGEYTTTLLVRVTESQHCCFVQATTIQCYGIFNAI